jgi:hypothetical protein
MPNIMMTIMKYPNQYIYEARDVSTVGCTLLMTELGSSGSDDTVNVPAY